MSKFLTIVKYLLVINIILMLIITICFIIINHNLKYEMPIISTIELYDNKNTKYLSYSNNKKQSYIPLSNINDNVINAFITIEDKRFYKHHGVDLIRIGGAFIQNIKNRAFVEGASTITQQYVRMLFLNNDKTLKRKIYELLIASNIESKYTKEEILEGYLNVVYFDHGIYGIEDASIFYFGKHASELSLTEACCLASIPKGPSIYSPIKNPDQNLERRQLVLTELYHDGTIDKETYDNCYQEELVIIGVKPQNDNINAPYFQDTVLNEIKQMGWLNEYLYRGLKVYTTLDSNLNKIMYDSINTRAPKNDIEVAGYAIEPTTGNVLAVIGGKDYQTSTYNRAVNSVRQVGSSIKPFLYLTALEYGFTPATTFLSEETTFYINGESYSPHNFQNIYPNMDISMVYGIAVSDNIYAMKTHLFLGVDKLANTLKRFKISGDIPKIPSLALGTYEISLKELTTAYAVLANLGTYVEPTFITKITTIDDEILYEKKNRKTEQLADTTDVYLLNEAMTSIFDNNMTYNIRPTGGRLASTLSHTYSGKSGSTDTDNIMVGYNQDIVIAVWTGYDDNRLVTSTSDASFGKYVWRDAVEGYLEGKKNNWYETPENVVGIDLNPITGFYPDFDDYYKKIYFRKNNIPWYIKLIYDNPNYI